MGTPQDTRKLVYKGRERGYVYDIVIFSQSCYGVGGGKVRPDRTAESQRQQNE